MKQDGIYYFNIFNKFKNKIEALGTDRLIVKVMYDDYETDFVPNPLYESISYLIINFEKLKKEYYTAFPENEIIHDSLFKSESSMSDSAEKYGYCLVQFTSEHNKMVDCILVKLTETRSHELMHASSRLQDILASMINSCETTVTVKESEVQS